MSRHDPGPGALAPRERMIQSAKVLFAEDGYENTTTAAVAHAAGSSESQLIKHFGGKQGLLQTILDRGWEQITAQITQAVAFAPTPAAKLGILAHTVITGLERDPALRLLLLLEGRRVRRDGSGVALSSGFLRFVGLVDDIIKEMQRARLLLPGVRPQAMRSALIGMLEGMMRDQLLARSAGFPADFKAEDVPQILSLVLSSLTVPAPKAAGSARREDGESRGTTDSSKAR